VALVVAVHPAAVRPYGGAIQPFDVALCAERHDGQVRVDGVTVRQRDLPQRPGLVRHEALDDGPQPQVHALVPGQVRHHATDYASQRSLQRRGL
jgi:hypothetical protein